MLAPIQGKNAKTYPITSHNPLEPWILENLNTALHLLTQVGVEVTPWYCHANMKICKVCYENLENDEYHLLIACSKGNMREI